MNKEEVKKFYEEGIQKKKENEEKYISRAKEIEELELKNCTFSPNIVSNLYY